MPFNGAGVYSPPGADFPAVAGTLIESTKFNNVINDIATALSTCLTKDGQTTVTANIPGSNFALTNWRLRAIDGLAATPGITFDGAQSSGFYRVSGNTVGLAIAGGQIAQYEAALYNVLVALRASAVFTAKQQILLDGVISPAQITASQNDYNPTDLATSAVLRLSTDASWNLTGLQGGAAGRLVLIHNVGSNPLVLKDEDAASAAANRFALNSDLTLAADQSIVLWYDSTSSRWRAMSQNTTNLADRGVKNLQGSNNAGTPLTQYDFTWTSCIVADANGNSRNIGSSGGTLTLNISTAGPAANGRDQAGAFAASAAVHVFAIWNGATKAVIASTAGSPSAGPTLPTGYTHWAYLTTLMLDGSSQFYNTYAKGNEIFYRDQQSLVSPSATSRTQITTATVLPSVALSFGCSGYIRINNGGVGFQDLLQIYVVNSANIYTTCASLERESAGSNTSQGSGFAFEAPNTGYLGYNLSQVTAAATSGAMYLNRYTIPQ